MPISSDRIGLLLLAAGRSERFGGGSKLHALIDDQPLGLHVVHTAKAIEFGACIAVVGPSAPNYGAERFIVLETDRPEAGQGYSIALGLRHLMALPIEACLILLADMPFVTMDHIAALMARFDGSVIASSLDDQPMPPALIGRQHFGALASLGADMGARTLIAGGKLIAGDQRCLADIDTPDDLERWR
jgi:molybdenum cofactor cytidylyltransferase